MSEPVYILGGARTDFKRNLKKEGKTIRHLITEAGKKALDDAKIDPGEIEAGAVGNFNAGQFTKQLQLGAKEPDVATVAWKNYAHAKLNPRAQMLDAELTLDCASQVSDKNPSVAPPLKVSDCSQITDGSASVVLVSGKYLDKIGRDKNKTPRLLGFGHTTDYLPLDKKDAPTFSIARKAAEKAFGMANLKPRDLNGADVHDCFSVTEIVVYEILGLAEPGKGAELARSGATALPQVRNEKMKGTFAFEIPVNAGGGLIADGHPVGATGVRQVVEAYQHLTGQAGARQIQNAKRFLTFNMGGSLTTSVAMLWGRD